MLCHAFLRADDQPRWQVLSKQLAEIRKQADARKQVARADFDRWLANAQPTQVSALRGGPFDARPEPVEGRALRAGT